MTPYTFAYVDGLPVQYVCRHGADSQTCDTGALCAAVGVEMLNWNRSMSGQARVRIAKRDTILEPASTPNYRRLLNE